MCAGNNYINKICVQRDNSIIFGPGWYINTTKIDSYIKDNKEEEKKFNLKAKLLTYSGDLDVQKCQGLLGQFVLSIALHTCVRYFSVIKAKYSDMWCGQSKFLFKNVNN